MSAPCTFSLLGNEEILQCVHELNIPMTLDELLKPTGDQVCYASVSCEI